MEKYEETGVLSEDDLDVPSREQMEKGVAVVECVQRIPCDPCVDVCPVDAISMKDINAPPVVDYDKCIGCKRCVGICPGLAIFVVKIKDDGKGLVTLPYEFLPVPEEGKKVKVLDRKGKVVDEGMVEKVVKQGKTWVVTVEVDESLVMTVRNIKV